MLIYMLTSQFPFSPTSEVFIIPELQALSDETLNLKILTVYNGKTEKIHQPYPSWVQVESIEKGKLSIKEKTLYTLQTIASREFYDDIKLLYSRKKLTLSNILKLVKSSVGGRRISKSVQTIIDRDGEDRNNILLYAYWMTEMAYAVAKICQKTGIRAICRAHGYDYDEDRHDGYIPLRRYIFCNLTRIFCDCESGVSYITSKYGYRDKIEGAYLGTINDDYPRIVKRDSPFRIASCAYAIPLKRIDLIARALCTIEQIDIEWVHFGDGPEMGKVKKIAEQFPQNIKFRLMGNCPQEQILQFYKNEDVHLFIHVSTKEGGVPTVIKESMSFGIPALVTSIGANKEIVQDGFNGKLVPVDIGAEELGRAITNFINMSCSDYVIYRENAYSLWKRQYDARIIYPQFYEKIKRLVDD